jgi:hypothetical protein
VTHPAKQTRLSATYSHYYSKLPFCQQTKGENMSDAEYIKQLESAVIFLSQTYLRASDAMHQFPNAYIEFPVIQGTLNQIALIRISELKGDRTHGFGTLAAEMASRH